MPQLVMRIVCALIERKVNPKATRYFYGPCCNTRVRCRMVRLMRPVLDCFSESLVEIVAGIHN